jgi:ATP-dependent DNA helicase RecG
MGKGVSEFDIQFIKGVGPRKAFLLNRLGISTVMDAMLHFPVRYEDRKSIGKICDLVPGELQTVAGKVISTELKDLRRGGAGLFGPGKRRGGLKLFELSVSDESGVVKAKWFNQPFMKKRFRVGQRVVLSGMVKSTRWGIEIDNPEYELPGDDEDGPVQTARVVPIYSLTENLSSRQLRKIIDNVLSNHLHEVEDPIPAEILGRHGMPGMTESIMNTHSPPDDADVGRLNRWETDYQKRLSFGELFMFEMGFALLRRDNVRLRGIRFDPKGELVSRLLNALSFSLTRSQERVFFEEILPDMEGPFPMNRLLQGDVGSGKTVVALMALLTAVECGYQAAIMAPTEILAEQHYANIRCLVEDLGLSICLLSGSVRQRPLDEISGGGMNIVVGTHALIQESVRFKKLGLAVVDEQHRFGVKQRAVLRKKALNPDVLIMTATPIPRTLSLTLYGDLDYSVIRELPPGRTPVLTEMHTPDRKARVYEAIESEVEAGGQVYVVYPVIEESEKTNLRSAMLGEEALVKVFPRMRVSLVHGRMKPADKEAVMEGFKRGEVDILVSTTVVEVGVDVANASMMVIVHAERFGLSQLHQLRGRVGRGGRRSRCLLLAYGPIGEDARRRLDVMCSTTDGFRVAEEDLRIRGPGEFLGTRQSGLPDMRVADIVRDAELLEVARKEAFSLVDKDPGLEGHPRLRVSLEVFWRDRIELFKTG